MTDNDNSTDQSEQTDQAEQATDEDESKQEADQLSDDEITAAAATRIERLAAEETDPQAVLNGHDVEAALLEDWRIMFGQLHARFKTGDFNTGVKLVDAIGKLADKVNHHPDVTLTYPVVEVRLTSHDVGGLTSRDIELARQISDAAGQVRADADTNALQTVELCLDTPDFKAIKPFWAAVLGYAADDNDSNELFDPSGRLPTIWFQTSEPNEEPDQRWHYDIRVPPEVAERRIKAALDAGGTMADDRSAPSFTVLADAQGNKACICTWLNRD